MLLALAVLRVLVGVVRGRAGEGRLWGGGWVLAGPGLVRWLVLVGLAGW